MVRSDWSKKWTEDPVAAKALAADPNFPGVGLDALKFLHRKRHILFHGHEPLDTDTTPTLEGEALADAPRLHAGRGRRQPRGGAARSAASSTSATRSSRADSAATRATSRSARPRPRRGMRISSEDAPLPEVDSPLHWDEQRGFRTR